ncbi:MAG: Ig-like domain-containing protein [Cyclobacteriaceae bacterium]
MRINLVFICAFFLQYGFSQNTWTETGGPFGGNVESLKRTSAGTLYAVINQRLFSSTNSGDSWTVGGTTQFGSLNLGDLMVDVNGIHYAVYYSQLYSSTDGLQWDLVSSNQFQGGLRIMAVGPDNVFVVWGYNGVYTSIDQGINWTQISSEGWSGEPGLWANSSGDIFYAVQGGKLLRHTYQGLTTNWSSSNLIELTDFTTKAAGDNVATMTIDNTGQLFVATFGNVFKSTNNGNNFTSITANLNTAGLSYFDGRMATSPDNAIYYFAHDNKLYKSVNQGANWTSTPGPSINYGSRVERIAFASASTFFVGTQGDGVFRTTNTAVNWAFKSNGLTGANTAEIIIANTSNKIIAVKNANSYWSSSDNGTTWNINVSTDYIAKALKHSSGTLILYGSKTFRSTNNGASFSDDGMYYYHNKMIEGANGNLYGFKSGTVEVSVDQGANWADLGVTGLSPTFIADLAAIDASDNMMCFGYDGGSSEYKTYKIVGTTATEITAPNPVNTYINSLFQLDNKFYMAQFQEYYYTSDLGANWTAVGFSGERVMPLDNGTFTGVAVSKYGNLSITQDDGGTWNSTNTPPNARITDIAVDASGDFYASANGSSVLKYTNELLVDPGTLPPYIDFNWQPLNGPYGGRVNTIEIHPDGNTLFAISNNRLWKFSGGLWNKIEPVAANGIVYDVDIDVSGNVYIIPLANPQKVYKSADLGVSWTPLTSTGLPASSSSIRNIEVLSDGSILAFGLEPTFTYGVIYKSTNAGASFTLRHTSASMRELYFGYGFSNPTRSTQPIVNPTTPGTVMVFGLLAEGMVVSTDFGTTWTVKSIATAADPTNGFVGSYMYDKDGNILMHAIFDNSVVPWSAEIWKSSDNGTSWAVIPTPSPAIPGSGNFYSKRIVTLGTGEYIMNIQSLFDSYRSTDGGATWNLTGNVGDVFIWSATAGNTSYLLGSSTAGILKTEDGGQTFTAFSEGIPQTASTEIKLLNNKDMLVGAIRPYYSDDFGQTFTLATLEPAANYLQVGDSLIGYGSRLLLSSNDGGKTWTSFGTDRYFNFLTADATGLGFYGSDGFALLYSTDLLNWTEITLSGLPTSYNIGDMVIDAGGVIFAIVYDIGTQKQEVYKIVFGSASKISSLIGTTEPSSILYVNNKIYLYDSRGIIYKSSDGNVWTQISAPNGNSLIATNNYLFIPSSNSVLWLSRNDGGAWQSVGDVPESQVEFRDVVINEFDGFAYATLSNSVARKSGNMVLTDDGIKPVVAALSPANNSTDIAARPDLTITFDEATTKVAGKKIRIFDQAQPALPIHVLDAGDAVQNLKSFTITPPSDLSYLKTYFVVIDGGAFVDIFGNEFNGISSQTAWRFTIEVEPDVLKPTVTLTTDDLALVKGTARTFEISATDNRVLPTDKSRIWYRGISKPSETSFTSAGMTVTAGSGTVTASYAVEAQDQWYDPMGLEFYFEVTDASGNVGRSPATSDTYHYSYITYPSSANPEIASGRVSFGGQSSNYRIFTIPYDLEDPQVLAVLNELGGIDKTKWRMFTYAGNEQFTENPTNFERGRGYWINIRNSPGNIQIEGASSPQNNRTNFFSIDLNPGWNQIGNPYPVDISWEQVRATNTATVGPVKVFNGSNYTDGDILTPYQGGFVFVTEPSPISLKVRFKDITSGGRKKESAAVDLDEPNWQLPIVVGSNSTINASGGFGMNEEAKMGWDQFDDINPPRFSDFAELSFDRARILDLPFAKDIVPTQDEFSWDLSAYGSGGIMTLNWDNALISGEKDLYLFDAGNQHITDMKAENSYSFDAKDVKLRVYFGKDLREKIKPTKVTLGTPSPNPMTGRSRVDFTLPENQVSYYAQLEVYDTQGRRISILENGSFEPGFYSSEWIAGDNTNGLYFFRLTVTDANGVHHLTKKAFLNR